jgi:hypothetical protein
MLPFLRLVVHRGPPSPDFGATRHGVFKSVTEPTIYVVVLVVRLFPDLKFQISNRKWFYLRVPF